MPTAAESRPLTGGDFPLFTVTVTVCVCVCESKVEVEVRAFEVEAEAAEAGAAPWPTTRSSCPGGAGRDLTCLVSSCAPGRRLKSAKYVPT